MAPPKLLSFTLNFEQGFLTLPAVRRPLYKTMVVANIYITVCYDFNMSIIQHEQVKQTEIE